MTTIASVTTYTGVYAFIDCTGHVHVRQSTFEFDPADKQALTPFSQGYRSAQAVSIMMGWDILSVTVRPLKGGSHA